MDKSQYKLCMRLGVNDFKTKYAGSYLGIIWAFVQPVITILVYWFVFSTLRSRPMRDVPFILWLMAGLIPWFFFSDGLNSGTNALIEYSYLVKKVVFNITILPIVKLISVLFVHIFFVSVLLIMYIAMGHFPGLPAVQILYYSGALFVLILGLSYLTSSIVVFFRDLSQIINIILQVGVWMTPIMWNFDDFGMKGPLRVIFQLNPLYYIVEGYRSALIDGQWFWSRPYLTLYFWAFTALCFFLGKRVFKKLRVHFADVL